MSRFKREKLRKEKEKQNAEGGLSAVRIKVVGESSVSQQVARDSGVIAAMLESSPAEANANKFFAAPEGCLLFDVPKSEKRLIAEGFKVMLSGARTAEEAGRIAEDIKKSRIMIVRFGE